MLIVPVFTRNDQKKIPYICILLILANSLIFFLLQSNDTRIEEEAYGYYEDSGLLDLELGAYKAYLAGKKDPGSEVDLQDEEARNQLIYRMFADDEFQELLEEEKIIARDSPRFQEWNSKKKIFEDKLSRTSTYRYGYSPKRQNATGLFTCMFMHGSFMHLLGNMVFLYLVGAILEAAIGPLLFILLYLIAGVCSSALFGLVYPATPGPLIGASGAISGLMGAYGVIFGLRKIRVFYSLGFYFNYAMVPALVLFPVWLANEFFQLYANENSNVAYVAHIGGLISGIFIGGCYKIFLKERVDALFAGAEKKQSVDSYMARGQERLVELDLDNARREFERVLAIDPGNLQAIKQLYVIDKGSPESDRFHVSAGRLLKKLKNGPPEEYLEIFEDYREAAGKPKMDIDMLETLSFLYLKKKQAVQAAPIVSTLLKKKPESTNLPGYLLDLGDGFQRIKRFKEAVKCYRVLVSRYPVTAEADTARNRLKKFP